MVRATGLDTSNWYSLWRSVRDAPPRLSDQAVAVAVSQMPWPRYAMEQKQFGDIVGLRIGAPVERRYYSGGSSFSTSDRLLVVTEETWPRVSWRLIDREWSYDRRLIDFLRLERPL